MPHSMWKEFHLALSRAWWELVREPEDRKPLTWSNVPNAFAYLGPFLFMAYLVRRRDTRPIRLLLLPTVVVMAIRCTYSYDWHDPNLYFFTWIRGLLGLAVIATSIDFGLVKEGRYKVGELALPPVYDTSSSNNSDSAEGPPKEHPKFLSPWIIDALEVTAALRGIGWDFGKGVHIPKDTRPLDNKPAFLRQTAKEFLRTYLLVDLFDMLQKAVPGVGSNAGGSIFFSDLPFIPRYVLSTLIAAGTGALMIAGFENLYAGVTLIGVGLLGHSPTAWPPLMDHPWDSDSINTLWTKRWHQAFRRTFLVLGGKPGGWIAGRVGVVLGAFLASGVFHECGMHLMGRGFDHRVTVFFLIQGVLVILEKAFTAVTGRRVRGPLGKIWTYVNVLAWSQLCVDAWYVRGLGGSTVVPLWMSPVRLILMPVLRFLLPGILN